MNWTADNESALRAEVERRFRMRTPAKDIYDADWKSRVGRSEMRTIAMQQCNQMPPETDREWLAAFATWYLKMAKRALRELDVNWKETLRRNPPSPKWHREV